jgi:hypothetical protein
VPGRQARDRRGRGRLAGRRAGADRLHPPGRDAHERLGRRARGRARHGRELDDHRVRDLRPRAARARPRRRRQPVVLGGQVGHGDLPGRQAGARHRRRAGGRAAPGAAARPDAGLGAHDRHRRRLRGRDRDGGRLDGHRLRDLRRAGAGRRARDAHPALRLDERAQRHPAVRRRRGRRGDGRRDQRRRRPDRPAGAPARPRGRRPVRRSRGGPDGVRGHVEPDRLHHLRRGAASAGPERGLRQRRRRPVHRWDDLRIGRAPDGGRRGRHRRPGRRLVRRPAARRPGAGGPGEFVVRPHPQARGEAGDDPVHRAVHPGAGEPGARRGPPC